MYEIKKKEKEILTRIEKRFRDLKSNLRKKISLEEMMHSSSFKQGLSGKQKCQTVHVELKKKKKEEEVQEPFESRTSECHFQFWRLDTYPGYIWEISMDFNGFYRVNLITVSIHLHLHVFIIEQFL